MEPESVGNKQRVFLSDLDGRSNIMFKARKVRGYDYSAAEASYEILFFKTMGWSKRYFLLRARLCSRYAAT